MQSGLRRRVEILPITASPLYVQDSAVKASEGWLVMDVGGRMHFAQISLQEGESSVAADGLWKQSLGLGPFSPPHSRAPLKLRRRPAPARGHRGPPWTGASHTHRPASCTLPPPLLPFKLSPPPSIDFLCHQNYVCETKDLAPVPQHQEQCCRVEATCEHLLTNEERGSSAPRRGAPSRDSEPLPVTGRKASSSFP